jgi:hypothetical protein
MSDTKCNKCVDTHDDILPIFSNTMLGFTATTLGFTTVLHAINHVETKKLPHKPSRAEMRRYMIFQRSHVAATGFLLGSLWVMSTSGLLARFYASKH